MSNEIRDLLESVKEGTVSVEDALKDAYNDDRMSLNTLNLLMHKIFGVEMTETSEEDMSFEELLGEYNF